MLEVLLKPAAEIDMSEIYEYTFYKWGLKQADKYQDELFHGIEQIARQEFVGKTYSFSGEQYRFIQVNRHLIFYRIEGESCVIVRVLHDRMDISTHL